MATKKTWIWIIVAFLGVCVVGILGVAGAGIYFVASHIETKTSTMAEAFQEFDRAKAMLGGQKPLFELDEREHPRLTRQLSAMPTSTTKPEYLWILAWDPDNEGRLIKLNLPFWLLRFGNRKIQVLDHESGFNFERLNLDVNELERVGPLLLVDHRARSGERVLVWTK
jgi:hypothetical protein